MQDESNKTPNCIRSNRFFGIPLTDSASNSPRWPHKTLRKSPLERTEFASDSLEAAAQNEGDHEAILQHLNRQVRLDRKSLIDLYMELDEERSASAVAANNAMAMITRLQAEKATVQMEALQYQRMMEEEAEYDQEALRGAYEMIERREEEINMLEAELNAYREKHGPLPDFSFRPFREEIEQEDPKVQPQFQPSHSFKSDYPNSPARFGRRFLVEESAHDSDQVASPLSCRGEKMQLLGRMKKLERRAMSSSLGNVSFKAHADAILEHETGLPGKPSEDHLKQELSQLCERVKALETDEEFLEHVTKKQESSNDGTKILQEISMNLDDLRCLLMAHSEEDTES